MKRLKTSVVAWSALFAVMSFQIFNQIISHDGMLELSSSLVLAFSFAVLVRWGRDAMASLRDGREGTDFLVVGVFALVLIVFFQRVWVIALRAHDRAEWLVNSPISAFIAWMLAWACTMVLIAPDAANGTIPNRSKVLIAVALFMAGLISGISVTIFLT